MSQMFTRRRFLQSALMATGAFVLSPLGQARAAKLDGVHVLVIGAGCAGLGAASALKKQGARVTVLEARPHIGGRVQTDWSMGAPFEVGAGWIHGPSAENPSKQLCDAVGSEYVVTDNDNAVTLSSAGEQWSDDKLEKVGGDWWRILEDMEDRISSTDNRSVRQAVSDLYPQALTSPGMLWAFSAYSEFSAGAPIEDLSAAYFTRGVAFPGDDVVVATGYDKMLVPLASGLDIHLSTVVSEVIHDEDGVALKTDKGEFSGDFVICTLPLGVLKRGTVKFTPELPAEYQTNIQELGFNSVTKLAMKFPEPFWDTDTQYFGIDTQAKGRWNYWLNYRTFSLENIFLGLSVGAYAPVADAMSRQDMALDGLEVLREVWGEESVQKPTQVLSTHWSTDPYTFGAYAYPRPGVTPNQFDDLSEPVNERVLLAGEHTIFKYTGTTHGAYMSGLRAAEHVLDLL